MPNLDKSRNKFEQSSTLSITFVLFLILAVSLPMIFLTRIGYDYYSQTMPLEQRKMFKEHAEYAQQIDRNFRLYRESLRDLNLQFYNHKIFKKIPGGTDSRLWMFDRGKRFQRDLHDEDEVLDNLKYGYRNFKRIISSNFLSAKNVKKKDKRGIEDIEKYLSSKGSSESRKMRNSAFIKRRLKRRLAKYNKHNFTYKTHVWDQLDNNREVSKLPLFMQIYVWEQYVSTDSGGFQFSNIDKLKSFKESGDYSLRKYLDRIPVHQVFDSRDTMLAWCFDELSSIFRDILVAEVFGKEFLREDNNIDGFYRITGKDILNSRGKFIPLKIIMLDLEIYWNLLPANFSQSAYKQNEIVSPLAIYCAIFDRSKSEKHYLDLMQSERRTKYLNPISKKLDLFKQSLSANGANFSVIDSRSYLRRENNNISTAITALEFTPQTGYIKQDSEGSKRSVNFEENNDFILVDELTRVLNQKTGEFVLKDKDLIAYLIKSLGENEINNPNFKHLLDLIIKTGKPLFFTYKIAGKPMLGSLFASSILKDKLFFFSQSQLKFQAILQQRQILIVGLIVLNFLLVTILGRALSRRVVGPIMQLTEKISRMAHGKYDEKVNFEQVDEIGRLGNNFNKMAEEIQEKLFTMRSIGAVNRLMNHDLARRTMLKYILHLLSIRYRATFGLIGFFEGGLSANPSDYSYWQDSQLDEELMSTVMETVASKLYPQNKTFVVFSKNELIQYQLPFENAVSFYSSPESSSGLESVEVIGVVFMANVDQSLLSSLESEENHLIHPVYHLCNQAKTVVVKTLLDEIEGDTKKGQEIQESLMPVIDPDFCESLDIAHFFKGARGLAGDYLDFQMSEDKKLVHFSIADVSGKGIGPSLFGAKSKALMRVLTDTYPRLTDKVLGELNRNLCLDKQDSLFLTMFYCSIDLESLTLFYSSAGHNKMLLVRKNSEIIHLNAKGIPVGLFSTAEYEAQKIKLEVGDSIVLYTDGVTELENASQELYGQEKFENFCSNNRSISAQQFVSSLSQELDEFRNGIFLSDDITFIVIKIKDGMA